MVTNETEVLSDAWDDAAEAMHDVTFIIPASEEHGQTYCGLESFLAWVMLTRPDRIQIVIERD